MLLLYVPIREKESSAIITLSVMVLWKLYQNNMGLVSVASYCLFNAGDISTPHITLVVWPVTTGFHSSQRGLLCFVRDDHKCTSYSEYVTDNSFYDKFLIQLLLGIF